MLWLLCHAAAAVAEKSGKIVLVVKWPQLVDTVVVVVVVAVAVVAVAAAVVVVAAVVVAVAVVADTVCRHRVLVLVVIAAFLVMVGPPGRWQHQC